MDLDHALRVFRLYCYHLKRDPSDAESMLLTDNEKEAILKLKEIIKAYADLIATERGVVSSRAA